MRNRVCCVRASVGICFGAQLGVCIGDTLFVHGAVSRLSIGFVPSDDTKDAIHEVRVALSFPSIDRSPFLVCLQVKGTEMKDSHTAQEWITALNAWSKKHVEGWKAQPYWQVGPWRLSEY